MPTGLELLNKKLKKELKGKINPRTKEVYCENDIRAIATSKWKESNKKEYFAPKNQIIESYNEITVQEGVASPTQKNSILKISGVAINAGVTRNNVNYVDEELKNGAKSLIGVPIMKNHSNNVEDIIGRVTAASYDEGNKRIIYAGDIMDNSTQAMVKDGRINQVSIRAKYEKMEEDEDNEGVVIVKGLSFLELSAVAIPGDPGATLDFNSYIREAYDKNIQEEVNKMSEEIKKEEIQVTKDVSEMDALKLENTKLLNQIKEMEDAKKEEEVEEPIKEPKEEIKVEEPVKEESVDIKELEIKVKQLEETLSQGKGAAIKSVETKVTSDFVREYVPGVGMTIYKKGVI